ncbi:hypothetical protein EIN_485880 [Entamoeba invadens IP1]|uniref:DNA alkylation repair enzyme n=1 Tax=Entamoeba invadens IP1 TaxID=370355 RepID=A0A0A1U4K6_ENTIV|nr:hypothetical protein EIN_485880 [Entamoeba invadens IP1]ELP89186.1 hypothetical protein EIN_485880 [Entamoeba invadens IP1]|eukprot:XP_004255957.1 hypothetical protein EIN_485880 [Entamoeba invadens IP1]
MTEIIEKLKENTDTEKSKILMRFFKTGKGEYGEGDIFIGVPMPKIREIVKTSMKAFVIRKKLVSGKTVEDLLNIAKVLLENTIHEVRVAGGEVLKIAKDIDAQKVYQFYIENTSRFNNWDLVDLTCISIVGGYLENKDKSILYQFAESDNLWERRISIVSTLYFIRKRKFKDALKLCRILQDDEHDLIHKACGWMLREIGKKNEKTLTDYLDENGCVMPAITRAYACEKLSPKQKEYYKTLAKKK